MPSGTKCDKMSADGRSGVLRWLLVPCKTTKVSEVRFRGAIQGVFRSGGGVKGPGWGEWGGVVATATRWATAQRSKNARRRTPKPDRPHSALVI